MKRILSVFLASLLCFCLFACSGSDEPIENVSKEESSLVEESSEVIPAHEPYVIAHTAESKKTAEGLGLTIRDVSGIDFELVEITGEADVKPEMDVVIGIVPSFVELTYTPFYHGDNGYTSKDGIAYIFGANADSCEIAAMYFVSDCVSGDGISEEITERLNFNGFPYENATLNGNSLKDFTIVCAATENEAKYEDVGNELNAFLLAEGNFNLPVSTSKTATYEKEIVIGYSARRGMLYDSKKEAEYGLGDYRILISGTKVYIEANNACGAWHAMKRFASLFADGDVTDQEITGTCDLIKVACVGDSITQGNNSADYHKTAYPVYLQRMLGYDYYVKNYGASGYSVVFEDEYSYKKNARYKEALELGADIMIFMLGTNDGNPSKGLKEWEGTERETRYYNNVNEYLDSFIETNPEMQIFMCLPAPLFSQSTRWGDWAEWARRIEEYVIPLNSKIAEERNLPIVDIHSWAVEHPEMFPDGLHPLEETYKDYAQRVYDEIIGKLKYIPSEAE